MFNPIKYRYQNEAGEGGEGGSGEKAPDVSELQATIESLTNEKNSMKAKMDELLGETKRAKELRRQAEEQARIEAEEKARKAGDYEQLHKSSEQQRQQLQKELEDLKAGIANEKRNSTAMKVASELAEGANAEILSEFVAKRLKYTDDGIKVLNDNGELTVSTLEDLKAEFQSNNRFAALLKGSQASGGSASGGSASSPTEKVMTRSDFDNATPAKRSEFIKGGGKVVD